MNALVAYFYIGLHNGGMSQDTRNIVSVKVEYDKNKNFMEDFTTKVSEVLRNHGVNLSEDVTWSQLEGKGHEKTTVDEHWSTYSREGTTPIHVRAFSQRLDVVEMRDIHGNLVVISHDALMDGLEKHYNYSFQNKIKNLPFFRMHPTLYTMMLRNMVESVQEYNPRGRDGYPDWVNDKSKTPPIPIW